MKYTLKTFVIISLFINLSCSAQMVQTPDDAYQLKNNEQQFIDKPLNTLLKQIKPEIKLAFATLDYPSYFSFRFISAQELNQKVTGRKLIGLYVYVKEPVEWDFNKRTKGKEYQWTEEDIAKYGNLTVIRIKVIERIEE